MIFYDFEVFKYDWLVVCHDMINRKETVIVNDPVKLEEYYNEHKDDYWIGFNSRDYDRYILHGILCGFNPKEINDWIIVKRRKGWEFSDVMRKNPINNFDVMTGFLGLKQLEAFMGNDIRETSVPFDIDRKLTQSEIEETIRYCRHDVEQTIAVFLERIVEFNSQRDLINIFDLPRLNIGQTQAQLSARILGAERKKFCDEYDIRLPETLDLPDQYRYIADWFVNATEDTIREMKSEGLDWKDPDTFNKCFYSRRLKVDVAGVPHVFGWGGIHGAITQYTHVCQPDEYLIMADVDQLYPTLMVEYGLLSRAVPKSGFAKFKTILETSLRLKAEKKKKEREPYKRICNITYGAMGDKYNPMYDTLHRNLVCVFGQILLLDLISKLEPFCKLIQSNTDGILMLIKKQDFERFDDVVYEWEERTRMHMSFDFYEKVVQKDVNNYIVVDDKGGCKSKGAYVKQLSTLDNDLPIVNRAICDYIVKGVHPRETVYGSDDLIDFQKVVKVSGKYSFGCLDYTKSELVPVIHYPEGGGCRYNWNHDCAGGCEIHGFVMQPCRHCNNFTPKNAHLTYERHTYAEKPYIRLNDKTFRVFASTRPEDGSIAKMKKGKDRPEKFANTPERCFIWNESVNGVEVPEYLDRQWYVDLAIKRINDFGLEV